jgi:hypothetical protein
MSIAERAGQSAVCRNVATSGFVYSKRKFCVKLDVLKIADSAKMEAFVLCTIPFTFGHTASVELSEVEGQPFKYLGDTTLLDYCASSLSVLKRL